MTENVIAYAITNLLLILFLLRRFQVVEERWSTRLVNMHLEHTEHRLARTRRIAELRQEVAVLTRRIEMMRIRIAELRQPPARIPGPVDYSDLRDLAAQAAPDAAMSPLPTRLEVLMEDA